MEKVPSDVLVDVDVRRDWDMRRVFITQMGFVTMVEHAPAVTEAPMRESHQLMLPVEGVIKETMLAEEQKRTGAIV